MPEYSRKWAVFVGKHRKARRLTRRDLARLASMHPSYMTLIEGKGYVPKRDRVRRLAHALEVPESSALLAAGYSNEVVSSTFYDAHKAGFEASFSPRMVNVLRQIAGLNLSEQERIADAIRHLVLVARPPEKRAWPVSTAPHQTAACRGFLRLSRPFTLTPY